MNIFNCVSDITNTTNLPYYSDKSILPQSILESLLAVYGNDSLPSPLIFKVTNKQTRLSAFIGVKEFTAEENSIILPGIILEKLKIISEDDELQLSLQDKIPKGESLTLKSLKLTNTDNIINLKFFLEAYLSINYTTLTANEILSITNTLNNKNETFEFLISKTVPGPTICIINTDMVFDLEPMDDEDAEKLLAYKENLLHSQKPSKPLTNFNNISEAFNSFDRIIDTNNNMPNFKINQLDLSQLATIRFTANEMYEIPLLDNDEQFSLSFTVSCSTGEEFDLNNFDILASYDRFIAPDSFIWSSINSSCSNKQKIFTIQSIDRHLINQKSIFFVGNCWAQSDAEFHITVVLSSGSSEPFEKTEGDETVCKNCGKKINKSNLFLHENFCLRNNIRCPKGCGQVFLKKIPDSHWHCDVCFSVDGSIQFGNELVSFRKHQKLNHEPILAANGLPEFTSFLQMALYKATIWENKLHECRFCHLILPKGKPEPEDIILNLSHHENIVCGSKTTDCFKCGKIVKFKDLESHLRIHDLNRLSKNRSSNYVKCHNVNCVNVFKANSASDNVAERLGLCGNCFGQFYSTSYDPDFKKLVSRIERRYMIQLTRGCGNGFCKNKFCLSSGLAEKKSANETYTLVKTDLMLKIPDLKNPLETYANAKNSVEYYFCVSELVTKNKLLVDHYYQSFFQNQYMYYWVCLAVLSLKGSHNDAKDIGLVESWLKDNAVTVQEMQA